MISIQLMNIMREKLVPNSFRCLYSSPRTADRWRSLPETRCLVLQPPWKCLGECCKRSIYESCRRWTVSNMLQYKYDHLAARTTFLQLRAFNYKSWRREHLLNKNSRSKCISTSGQYWTVMKLNFRISPNVSFDLFISLFRSFFFFLQRCDAVKMVFYRNHEPMKH